MRKLIFGAAICALASLCVLSCQKEVNVEISYSSEILDLTKSVVIDKNNTPVFTDFKNFQEHCQKTQQLTDEQWIELEHWGKKHGFISMRAMSIKLSDDYSLVDSKTAYDDFMAKYDGIVEINEKQSIEVKDYFPPYAAFLNIYGEVIIGEDLFKFTPKHIIQIVGGDRNKLISAIENPITNEKEGIYVFPIEIIETKATCPQIFVSYFCHVGSPQSHRLDNVYQLYFNTFACNSNIPATCWTHSNTFDAYIKSEKRGFAGAWIRHRTAITFSLGWGAQGDPLITTYQSGGTGWTTGSNQSEVHYQTAVGPFIDRPQIDNRLKYLFDYLYTNATTAEITSCSFGCQ